MARRLRSLVWNKLNIAMDFVGSTPKDNAIEMAVATRRPIAVSNPQNPFVVHLNSAADRILLHTYQFNEKLEDSEFFGNNENQDIEELLRNSF